MAQVKRTRKPPVRRVPVGPQDLQRAAAVKRFREQTGLTQTALATMLGVRQESLSAWEAGKRPIPPDVWQRLTDPALAGVPEPSSLPHPGQPGGDTGDAPPPGVEGEPLPGDLPPGSARTAGGTPGFGAPPPAGPGEPSFTAASSFNQVLGEWQSAKQTMANDLAATLMMVGLLVSNFEQTDGAIIYQAAPTLGQVWADAAEVSPRVRVLLSYLAAGPLAKAILTTVSAVLLPVAMHHRLIPAPQLDPALAEQFAQQMGFTIPADAAAAAAENGGAPAAAEGTSPSPGAQPGAQQDAAA